MPRTLLLSLLLSAALGSGCADKADEALPWKLYYCSSIDKACHLDSRFKFENDCLAYKRFSTWECPAAEGRPGKFECGEEIYVMRYEMVCTTGVQQYDWSLVEAADSRRLKLQHEREGIKP